MADVKYHSVAFVGSGSVEAGTATDLLNDWLPKNLGAALRPSRIPRKNASLNAIVNWLESEPDDDNDTLGPNGTKPSDDIITDLLKLKSEDGDEITIVYLKPEGEIPEAELELLRQARDENIPVKNLGGNGALDDLDWDEIFPPEPEPEDAPAEDDAAVQQVIDDVVATRELHPLVAHGLSEQLWADLRSALEAVIVNVMAQTRAEGATTISTVTPKLPTDKPPFDPPFKGAPIESEADAAERIKYYVSQDGRYRKALTRPPNNPDGTPWDVAMLTLEEIDSLVQRGLVDENKSGDKKTAARTSGRRASVR